MRGAPTPKMPILPIIILLSVGFAIILLSMSVN